MVLIWSSGLALGAEVGSASGENDAANGRPADEAGLALPGVHAVLDLEEAGLTVGVDVVGNRGTAGADGRFQNGLERLAEAQQPGAGETAGPTGGADFCAEEAFVGVDVAHAVEQRLVEQRGLDGELAAAEERDEVIGGNGEGFAAGSGEEAGVDGVKGETAETARVDEAQLAAGSEMQHSMGVRREGEPGGGDEQAAGHPEMDQQLGLRVRRSGFAIRRGRAVARASSLEVDDDVLADAVDASNAQAGERLRHFCRRGPEGLLISTEPGGDDSVAAEAAVHAVGDGFHFGEFGHCLSVEDRGLLTRKQSAPILEASFPPI